MGHGKDIKLPGFGRYLKSIRIKKGIGSQRQAADILNRKENFYITYHQINADEKGKVEEIPSARLRAYAKLYDTRYEEILAALVKEKYGAVLIPADAKHSNSIADVVRPENAEILESVEAALESDKGEKVRVCIEQMLDLAFGNYRMKRSTTMPEDAQTKNCKQEGAA